MLTKHLAQIKEAAYITVPVNPRMRGLQLRKVLWKGRRMLWERHSSKRWETPVQFPALLSETQLTLVRSIRISTCQTPPAKPTLQHIPAL